MNENAKVLCISISSTRGQKKRNVRNALLKAGSGMEGDAHSDSDRPISLLPYESFGKLDNPNLKINPGDFAENITTTGLDFSILSIGTRLQIGDSVILEVIQKGKECHDACEIKEITGDCIMPTEGIFGSVICGGKIIEGDRIKILS